MASHAWFADAYPTPETIQEVNETEERDGVAIDRISGTLHATVVDLDHDLAPFAVDNICQFCQSGYVIIAVNAGHFRVTFSSGMDIHMTSNDQPNAPRC